MLPLRRSLPIWRFLALASAFALVLLASGCGGSRYTDPDEPTPPTEFFSDTDLALLTDGVAGELLHILAPLDNPSVVFFPIRNRTADRVNMHDLSASLITALVGSGRVRVINRELREEVNKELELVTSPADEARFGRQVGAELAISGRLSSISSRTGQNSLVNYYLLAIFVSRVSDGTVLGSVERELKKELERRRFTI